MFERIYRILAPNILLCLLEVKAEEDDLEWGVGPWWRFLITILSSALPSPLWNLSPTSSPLPSSYSLSGILFIGGFWHSDKEGLSAYCYVTGSRGYPRGEESHLKRFVVPKDAQRKNNLLCSSSSNLVPWPLHTVCWLWEYPVIQAGAWLQSVLPDGCDGQFGVRRDVGWYWPRVACFLSGSFCSKTSMVGSDWAWG